MIRFKTVGVCVLAGLVLALAGSVAAAHDHAKGAAPAKEAEKAELPVGAPVPDFTLKTSDGTAITLSAYRGEEGIVALAFLSKSCPVSRAWHKEIAELAKEYDGKVKFLGLMSNSTEKTAEVTEFLRTEGIAFPILDDPGNKIADELDAIGTPHMYLVDRTGKLVYTGAINDSARDPKTVKKNYFEDAVAATLAGKPVAVASPDAFIGCSIKRAVKS